MTKGIYIVANDHAYDDTLAFMNSLSYHAPQYPVILIPYSDEYQKLARVLNSKYNVTIYDDRSFFYELEGYCEKIFGQRKGMFRKFACWFGPFDHFIYFDTDIVVFQAQEDVFDLLSEYDIVYCGTGPVIGIKTVFTERVFERNLFSKDELNYLFNAGFFASKKSILDYDQLTAIFDEAAAVSDIFDAHFTEQCVLNFVTLKGIPKRADLRELSPRLTPDAWLRFEEFHIKDNRIYTQEGMPVRHVHWAGYKPISHRPFVNLWLRYRYRGRSGAAVRLIVGFWFWIKRTESRFKRLKARILNRIGACQ